MHPRARAAPFYHRTRRAHGCIRHRGSAQEAHVASQPPRVRWRLFPWRAAPPSLCFGVLPSQAPTRGCCSPATVCGTLSVTRRRASWCAGRRRRSVPPTCCWAWRSASATRSAAARSKRSRGAAEDIQRIHPAAAYAPAAQMAAQPTAAPPSRARMGKAVLACVLICA